MKFLDRFTKKFTKSASSAVKTEVKKTALDLLPSVVGLGGMFLGIFLFKKAVNEEMPVKPTLTSTSITTNNYFFNEISEEMIIKIMEEQK